MIATAKKRPDLRAHLLKARQRIIREGVKQYFVVGPSYRMQVASFPAASNLAFAKAWGNPGSEFFALEYSVLSSERVCTFHERHLVEIMP